MMTIEEVGKEYQLDSHGCIASPGKFEGEPWWVVGLWDLALNGFSDLEAYDGDVPVSCFQMDDELAAMTGLEPSSRYLCLWESEQGFVLHALINKRRLGA